MDEGEFTQIHTASECHCQNLNPGLCDFQIDALVTVLAPAYSLPTSWLSKIIRGDAHFQLEIMFAPATSVPEAAKSPPGPRVQLAQGSGVCSDSQVGRRCLDV